MNKLRAKDKDLPSSVLSLTRDSLRLKVTISKQDAEMPASQAKHQMIG